ncbi:PREDICTED: uncharacterized protein LOC105972468 [Erythranthe guttata]|uniref:uncharacterized protein LOC105972468 n=1 Tax=Erythranthe guttata TaxID=4155 RepID=UPI00064DFC18|nr:PREDICTED: uncharacterized protein LOC105972468 [Erythranthe guttata]|eukprot:XP_012852886.1 PREDICTED: uncharacterized protein LOC105972468 [Erythranthe guttata]
MKKDSGVFVKQFLKCQEHGPLIHLPAEELGIMTSPCLLAQWGIDIVGPFQMATGQRRFLIVAVDYFSKWAEVEPLASINEASVLNAYKKTYVVGMGCLELLFRTMERNSMGPKFAHGVSISPSDFARKRTPKPIVRSRSPTG